MAILTFVLFICTVSGIYTKHVNLLDDNDDITYQISSDTHSVDSNECLQAHNLLRTRHENTPPLTWSNELASEAEKWAKKLIKNGSMIHSHAKGQGENLYKRVSAKVANCANAVKAWYAEIDNYNFVTGKGDNGSVVGHFTQIVSKRSTQVGVGVAYKKVQKKKNPNKFATMTMVVAKYTPAGNIKGKSLQNVMPVIEGALMPTLQPPVITIPPLCEDIDTVKACERRAKNPKHGPCDKRKKYFTQKCRKYCGFC